jgi:hypothetical protein
MPLIHNLSYARAGTKKGESPNLRGRQQPVNCWVVSTFVRPNPNEAEICSDSVFHTSAGTSGTATPLAGAQQSVQSNPMSAPPPKQISSSTSPQYEVEEFEDDLVTAPR